MSYAKRTIKRSSEIFLRECRAMGIHFELRDGRIFTDELGRTVQPYIKAHYAELVELLEAERETT